MTLPNSGRIAICGEIIPFSLKHDLLFFDSIGIFDLERKVKGLRERRDANADARASVANDFEFLQSQDIVFSAPSPVIFEPKSPPSKFKPVETVTDGEREEVKFIEEMFSERPMLSEPTDYQFYDSMQLFCARMCARCWQEDSMGLEFSAIRSTPLPKEVEQLLGFQRPSTDVIDVVLDKLPMPSEQTPWEQILDFKADTEAQGYLQGLKVWDFGRLGQDQVG